LGFGALRTRVAPQQDDAYKDAEENICCCGDGTYLSRPMPKPIARSKTKKAVRKRFKITARGKVLRSQSSRRHLMSAKNAKRKRQSAKSVLVDSTDIARIKANLPFG
jgi:large subunit ribosomal protein L35